MKLLFFVFLVPLLAFAEPKTDCKNKKLKPAKRLDACTLVLQAEPNMLFQVYAGTNDTYYSHQWNLENQGFAIQGNGTPGADMSVPEAWAVTTGDPGVIMACSPAGHLEKREPARPCAGLSTSMPLVTTRNATSLAWTPPRR